LSDRVRNSTKQFINRHFKRPSHDYRKVWTTITQRTVAVLDREELSRRMVGAIADTFETLSVTIWLADTGNNRFVFAASTSLDSRSAASVPVADAVYRELAALSADSIQPVDLDRSDEKWCALLKASNPSLFPEIGGHRLCMPLVFGGELAGLLVMGDRVRGVPFTVEDLELLKCLGDQMAAALRTLNLSEKLVRAKEMEAFQVMSAFLVHDLKNTASALSLTLRNLPVHFDNPAFREDALRTLSRSVQRVNELIGRLSTLRQKLELQRRPTDVNQLVAAALKSVGELPQIKLVQDCQPLPTIPVDAAQIESVIVNLLLNAREAISGPGEIHVTTRSQDGDVLLTVRDNGCGISPEFMANSLFKPFKTSKKTGLGIGMYQTKTVVDAHGGRLTVESEVGKGTTFRVLLPSKAVATISA
jgi:putative PEP-CTERM system histidine kinase